LKNFFFSIHFSIKKLLFLDKFSLPFNVIGFPGRGLGLYGFKSGRVRIMAINTEAINFFAIPKTGSPSMNTDLPVPEYSSMALAAEQK
jgi:hypothetical protein